MALQVLEKAKFAPEKLHGPADGAVGDLADKAPHGRLANPLN